MSFRLFSLGVALLLFVLPIPQTIALRNVLTLGLAIGTFHFWKQLASSQARLARPFPPALLWLSALTAWFVLQAVVVADQPGRTLHELFTQWLPALLSLLFGMTLGAYSHTERVRQTDVFTALLCVFLAQTVFSLLATFPDFLASGQFPQGRTRWTAGKLEISFWNNLALTLASIDLLGRWLYRQPLTRLPLGGLLAATLLFLLSNLAFGARNGVIGALLLIFVLAALVVSREFRTLGMKRLTLLFTLCALLAGSIAWGNLKQDRRWGNFVDTVHFAWNDTQRSPWLHFPQEGVPRMANGQHAEESVYLRVSWFRAGLELIAEAPLGVGYDRNAFGQALRQTEETRIGHSHSGMIDLGVGTGLPGLALWLGFCLTLTRAGLQGYWRAKDLPGLALAVLVVGFIGRMCLDSINRDHMLMVFFLTIGILSTFQARRQEANQCAEPGDCAR